MNALYPPALSRLPTKLVNEALTMTQALAWRAMARRNARSGGIFLMIGILGGVAVGVAYGEPMLGVLAGTALGIAMTLMIWLVDRRR
jgi:hypothetical protein